MIIPTPSYGARMLAQQKKQTETAPAKKESIDPAKLQAHPFAEIIPSLPHEEVTKLADSILKNGLRIPIVIYQGKILDGRHRYAACKIAGVAPDFKTFVGTDAEAIDLVDDLNLKHRHLTKDQIAMVVAKLAKLRRGRKCGKSANLAELGQNNQGNQRLAASVQAVADKYNVPVRLVEKGKRVLREGTKSQIAAITDGKLKISTAEREIAQKAKVEQPKVAPKRVPLSEKQIFKLADTIEDAFAKMHPVTDAAGMKEARRSVVVRRYAPIAKIAEEFLYSWRELASGRDPAPRKPVCQNRDDDPAAE